MIRDPQTKEDFEFLEKSNRLEEAFRNAIEATVGNEFLTSTCTQEVFNDNIDLCNESVVGLISKLIMIRLVREAGNNQNMAPAALADHMQAFTGRLADEYAYGSQVAVSLALASLEDMTNRPILN